MSALWFVLAFLALVGAGVLLYLDRQRHARPRRLRAAWAKERGLIYSDAEPELTTRWQRGVFAAPEPMHAVDVASGTRYGHQMYVFDLDETAVVIALARPTGSPVVFDLRLDSLNAPRERDMRLFGAIGSRIAFCNDLDVARRVCDRRMVSFAETAPEFLEVLWAEGAWAFAMLPVSTVPEDWDDAIAELGHFVDLMRVLPPDRAARRAPGGSHDPGHPHVF